MSSNTAESGTTAAVLEDIEQKCRELAITSPENTQKIAADLLGMGKAYYHDACMRAQQSFRVALGAAIVGIMFLFGASALVMAGKTNSSTYAAVSGSVVETLAAVVFVLHFKAVKQFGYFHVCLERMTRFMVANSVCTNIECGVKRDETRAMLVKAMLDAPMLPLFEDKSDHKVRGTSAGKARGATA
jgi:hypothetical protein